MAAKQLYAARVAPFEAAVDDGDRSRRVDGQLSHQQALSATVVAESRIVTARDDSRRRESPPAIPRMGEAESPRTASRVAEELPEQVQVVLAVETQCRETPTLECPR